MRVIEARDYPEPDGTETTEVIRFTSHQGVSPTPQEMPAQIQSRACSPSWATPYRPGPYQQEILTSHHSSPPSFISYQASHSDSDEIIRNAARIFLTSEDGKKKKESVLGYRDKLDFLAAYTEFLCVCKHTNRYEGSPDTTFTSILQKASRNCGLVLELDGTPGVINYVCRITGFHRATAISFMAYLMKLSPESIFSAQSCDLHSVDVTPDTTAPRPVPNQLTTVLENGSIVTYSLRQHFDVIGGLRQLCGQCLIYEGSQGDVVKCYATVDGNRVLRIGGTMFNKGYILGSEDIGKAQTVFICLDLATYACLNTRLREADIRTGIMDSYAVAYPFDPTLKCSHKDCFVNKDAVIIPVLGSGHDEVKTAVDSLSQVAAGVSVYPYELSFEDSPYLKRDEIRNSPYTEAYRSGGRNIDKVEHLQNLCMELKAGARCIHDFYATSKKAPASQAELSAGSEAFDWRDLPDDGMSDTLFDLFGNGNFTVIYAEKGSGKSMLTLVLSRAMAFGESFLGIPHGEKVRAVIYDGETRKQDLRNRVNQFFPKDQYPSLDAIKIVSRFDRNYDLTTEDGRRSFEKNEVQDRNLVILDNFSRFFRKGQRSGKYIDGFIAWIDNLCQTDCGVILVNHTEKDNPDRQGGPAEFGQRPTNVLSMTKDEKPTYEGGINSKLCFMDSKSMPTLNGKTFGFYLENGSATPRISDDEPQPPETLAKVSVEDTKDITEDCVTDSAEADSEDCMPKKDIECAVANPSSLLDDDLERAVYNFLENHPLSSRSEIQKGAELIGSTYPNENTAKTYTNKILNKMLERNLIKATWDFKKRYSVARI